jgi:hypothetical protein
VYKGYSPYPRLTSSPTFVVIFLDDSHSDYDETEFQCNIGLHFPLWLKTLNTFFMYLLAICTSLGNRPFSSLAHLLIVVFVLLVFHFLSSIYILDRNPLWDE